MNKSIIILTGAYLIFFIIIFGYNFYAGFYLIFILAVTFVVLLIALTQLFISIYKRKEIKRKSINFSLLLIPYFAVFLQIKFNNGKDIKILASNEGVISGEDIRFYKNNEMMYSISSLLGDKCFYGKYELVNDTFIIKYDNEIPDLDHKRMVIQHNELILISKDDKVERKYTISVNDNSNLK